jgi:hypothetical protein
MSALVERDVEQTVSAVGDFSPVVSAQKAQIAQG